MARQNRSSGVQMMMPAGTGHRILLAECMGGLPVLPVGFVTLMLYSV